MTAWSKWGKWVDHPPLKISALINFGLYNISVSYVYYVNKQKIIKNKIIVDTVSAYILKSSFPPKGLLDPLLLDGGAFS